MVLGRGTGSEELFPCIRRENQHLAVRSLHVTPESNGAEVELLHRIVHLWFTIRQPLGKAVLSLKIPKVSFSRRNNVISTTNVIAKVLNEAKPSNAKIEP
jgi:hypothetical protein